ncbi:R-linalool synthase [Nymphaea thermarum]|nr:R-linalool synthase [Nymphaea thermarum]
MSWSSSNLSIPSSDHNLHTVALQFRLFRQQGFYVSPDVFQKFKNFEGGFNLGLAKDSSGLMSLYEASYFDCPGEDILDEAKVFAKAHLEALIPRLHPSPANQIRHVLEHPLRLTLPRIGARHYIERSCEDQDMVELAILEFNSVQSLHQRDLQEFSKWWEELGIIEEIGFLTRNQPVLWFMLSTLALPEPQFSRLRIEFAKLTALIFVIDDMFDVYGDDQLDDLVLFVEAINRLMVLTQNGCDILQHSKETNRPAFSSPSASLGLCSVPLRASHSASPHRTAVTALVRPLQQATSSRQTTSSRERPNHLMLVFLAVFTKNVKLCAESPYLFVSIRKPRSLLSPPAGIAFSFSPSHSSHSSRASVAAGDLLQPLKRPPVANSGDLLQPLRRHPPTRPTSSFPPAMQLFPPFLPVAWGALELWAVSPYSPSSSPAFATALGGLGWESQSLWYQAGWVIVPCGRGSPRWSPLVGQPPHLGVSPLLGVLPGFVTSFGLSLLSASDGASGGVRAVTSSFWVQVPLPVVQRSPSSDESPIFFGSIRLPWLGPACPGDPPHQCSSVVELPPSRHPPLLPSPRAPASPQRRSLACSLSRSPEVPCLPFPFPALRAGAPRESTSGCPNPMLVAAQSDLGDVRSSAPSLSAARPSAGGRPLEVAVVACSRSIAACVVLASVVSTPPVTVLALTGLLCILCYLDSVAALLKTPPTFLSHRLALPPPPYIPLVGSLFPAPWSEFASTSAPSSSPVQLPGPTTRPVGRHSLPDRLPPVAPLLDAELGISLPDALDALKVSLPPEQLDLLCSSFAAAVAPVSRSSLARLRRELRRIGAFATSILPPGAARAARRTSLHVPSFGFLPACGTAGGILLAWSPPLTGVRQVVASPWLLAGDFNCLFSPADSSSPVTSGPSMSAFRSFVEEFGLFEVPSTNGTFTWSNHRNPPILRRLDRIFVSPELFSVFPSSSLVLGPRHMSDHAPLLLSLLRGRAGIGHARFRFELWWLRDESFVATVPNWWARAVNGRWAAFRLSRKLHSIRKEVIAWKRIFWSSKFFEVAAWDEEILSLQASDNISADQSSRLLCLQCLVEEWRTRESIHWQQRSRLSWLAHGDQNSRFFHLTASQRCHQTLLQPLLIGGRVFLRDDILPALSAHFWDFYSKPLRFRATLPDFHLSSLSVSCAIALERPFHHQEIKNAVWALGSGKAPGIDGFPIEFFRTFWEVCSADVFAFCDEFASNSVFLKEFNQATCVPVPKHPNPTDVTHFRLISILGAPYKIIAKLLSLRLAPVMPSVINPFQLISGLSINSAKCQLSLIHADPATILLAEACFGCKATSLPMDYLGLQITLSPPAPSFWDGLEQKLIDRLQCWQGKLLSLPGRITLARHCLASVPLHALSVFRPPVAVLCRFDKLIRKFVWDGDRPSDRLAHWDVVAFPRLLGGAGVTNLSRACESSLCFWWWRLATEHSPITQFISSKFDLPSPSVWHNSISHPSPSHFWSGMLSVLPLFIRLADLSSSTSSS